MTKGNFKEIFVAIYHQKTSVKTCIILQFGLDMTAVLKPEDDPVLFGIFISMYIIPYY